MDDEDHMLVGGGEGDPRHPGMYVVYINPTKKEPQGFAQRRFLVWDADRNSWFYPSSDQRYRGHVYQWVGPIPSMQLED